MAAEGGVPPERPPEAPAPAALKGTEADSTPDEIGTEVAALLQERHCELMRSITLWLRHEEEMVQLLFQTRAGRGLQLNGTEGPPAEVVGSFAEAVRQDGPGVPAGGYQTNQGALAPDGPGVPAGNDAGAPPESQAHRAARRGLRSGSGDMRSIGGVSGFSRIKKRSFGGAPLTDDEYTQRVLGQAQLRKEEEREALEEAGPQRSTQTAAQVKVCWLRALLQDLVQSAVFTAFSFVVILSNIVLVGVETDYSAGGLGSVNATGDDVFSYLNVFYSTLFTIELLLRVAAAGPTFFCSSNWQWNWFEVLLVSLSIVDVVLGMANGGNTLKKFGQNWMIRLFRVVRILRTLRIVRAVSFIREVCVVVQSITATLRSLIWAMVLMLIVLYGFGILITQAVSDYRATDDADDDAYLERHWSTLPRSILSLFQAATGGVSWIEVLTPLSAVSELMVIVFLVFFVFTYFCLLNVMTAVFCQNAIESATLDKEIASLALMAKKQQWSEEMRSVFSEMDSNQSGVVDVQEFERSLNDERMRAFLASREIDVHDAWTLFKLLDNDQRGVIEIDNFVDGLLQLKGPAKALQIAKVLHDGRLLRHQMQGFMEKVEDRLDQLMMHTKVPNLRAAKEVPPFRPSDGFFRPPADKDASAVAHGGSSPGMLEEVKENTTYEL